MWSNGDLLRGCKRHGKEEKQAGTTLVFRLIACSDEHEEEGGHGKEQMLHFKLIF